MIPENDRLAEIDPALGRGTRLPLSAVLLGVVLVVALAPLALFSLLTTREMKDALVTAEQERQYHLADSVAQQLDAFLEQVGREAVKIGEALATLGSDRETAPNIRNFLDDTVVFARYQPVAGQAIGARTPELVLPSAIEQTLTVDAQAILDQGAAAAPASARSSILSGPFALGLDHVPAVTVTAAVQNRGQLLGVYQEIALFHHVWADAKKTVPAPMQLFLLKSDGSTVPGLMPSGETKTSIRQRDIVQQFLRAHGRSGGSKTYALSIPGGGTRSVLGSCAATSHGWGVFVEVDERLALAPVDRITRLVTIGGLVAAALAVAAALLLGAVISRPITRLAQISTRLADGDFSVQASGSRVSELDMLAVNFNRMARRLGELVERFRTAAREANDMFLGTIRALAEAIDEKDPYTKGHSVRVNRYAVIVGRYLGLSREEMRNLQISSLLHDVGKIGIDDAILKKPAALLPEEFQVMKTHPERGAKIMGRIPQMKNIIPGMRFHHERYGGGGYPLGLRRDEIPLQARIIAVADTLDAMITDRPYQKSLPVADAIARINDLKGKQLDPQVVEAFNRAYEAGEFDDLFAPGAARPATGERPAENAARADASAARELSNTGPHRS